MSWISEAQKHYEEYVDYYTSLLDEYINDRILEMAPAYGQLQEMAIKHLEEVTRQLYDEQNPDFVPSRRAAKRLQEEFITKIIPELNLLNEKLQPYTTSIICGAVFYGANTTSYILEQAAKVPITVPNLTASGVLGVIANPWLPDKKTYSDRIRSSVALVASKAEETVKEVVTKRLQYSDAAKMLSGKIDEGYYNASRIVRTEMTRANALGTSYSLMENADIVDGKYRDATFDSKTAAYCAADADYSRKHPYDLDYDTPMNPGLPGRRIPNHPHCRCRWVAILSGLGIKDRQKAALDKDGERYYTNAATYDDYAKEVGLPSVKEMVNSDNPKRYLRPGETMEDLRRHVEPKTFTTQVGEKHTIIVPEKSCLIDKNAKRGILTVNDDATEPRTGALSAKNDPTGERRAAHAEMYYETVRNSDKGTMCGKVAKNSGMSLKAVEKVYDHVFIQEHDLDGGRRRFDPDFYMAQSWQRLTEGKNVQPHDITLLKHEHLELGLMQKLGMDYETAHRLTEGKYNYAAALIAYLEKEGL